MKLFEDNNFTSNSDQESDNSVDLETGKISLKIELNIQNIPSKKSEGNLEPNILEGNCII